MIKKQWIRKIKNREVNEGQPGVFGIRNTLFNTDKKKTAEKIKKKFSFHYFTSFEFFSGVEKHVARLQSPQMLWNIPLQDLQRVII